MRKWTIGKPGVVWAILLMNWVANAEAAEVAAAWSEPVNGLAARIVLKRFEVTNGTTIIVPFLELRNVSDLANPMRFAWKSAALTVHMVDATGKELEKSSGPYDGFVVQKVDLILPLHGELSFDIATRGAGISGDLAGLIDMGSDRTWSFKRDGKAYFMRVTLEIPGKRVVHEDGTWEWNGKMELPPVEVPLKAPPMDAAEAGKMIAELGPKLAENSKAGDDARRAMSLIEDERAIPWYVKAAEANTSHVKFDAVDKLSRFKGDAALAGLRIAMTTQGRDIGNASTGAVAEQSAQSIRYSAALGLWRSPNPAAKGLLLTMVADPYDAVRLTVARCAGEMMDPESLRVLETLSKDADLGVRKEAIAVLAKRNERPAPR